MRRTDLRLARLVEANVQGADLYCAQLSPEQHYAAGEAGAQLYDATLSARRHLVRA